MRRRGHLGPATSVRKVIVLDREVSDSHKNILTPRSRKALDWDSMKELKITTYRGGCCSYSVRLRELVKNYSFFVILVITLTTSMKMFLFLPVFQQ